MNGDTNYTHSSYPTTISLALSPLVTVLYIVIYLPVFVGTVVGNSLVILAFIKCKGLRKVSNYFLISLAVTDLLTGLFALPLNLAPRLFISRATCFETSRFNFFLLPFVLGGSSIYHISAIAIDRLLSIYFPLRYPAIVTPFRAKMALIVIWIYNILFALTPFFLLGGETDNWVCNGDNGGDNDIAGILIAIAIFIPVYFIVMLMLYAILLRKAMEHIRRHRRLANTGKSGDHICDANSRMQGVVTMAIVVGVFGLCWLPTSFQFFFEVFFTYNATVLLYVQTICEYPAYVNSMLNPIIYAKRNKAFSKQLQNVLI